MIHNGDAMEIGLSSASFYPHIQVENSIKVMKELGFDSGELFLNTYQEYEEDFAKKVLQEKLMYDFNIKSVHSFSSSFEPYLFDDYKRRRDDMFKYFKKMCRAARIMGATCYTFHGMRIGNTENVNWDLVIDLYNKLIYTAAEEGIKLAQENVAWCMSSNINFLQSLIEKCKYPIYFTLDIKQSYRASVPIDEYLKVMNGRLVNLHLNDKDEKSLCKLPGRGKVDFKGLFLKLKDMNYKGPGVIEVYSENYDKYDEIIESRDFLKKCII